MIKIKIPTKDKMTFEQGFEEFIYSCKARNLRVATISHYEEGFSCEI
jgi:integrase/recombinase XerD